jgi:hypothetical protein
MLIAPAQAITRAAIPKVRLIMILSFLFHAMNGPDAALIDMS